MKTQRLVEDFINHIRYIEPKSKATQESYIREIRRYRDYLIDHDLEDINTITYNDINQYIKDLRNDLSANSTRHHIVTIRQFHQYVFRLGLSHTDPSVHIKTKSSNQSTPRSLSNEELQKLFSFPRNDLKDHLDYAILLLLFRCGLRVSECTELTINQIYMEEKLIRVLGKGNVERMVPMTDDLVLTLKNYLQKVRPLLVKKPSQSLFLSLRGNLISRQYVHTMIKLRCSEADLSDAISAHTLRHTFATKLMEQGVDIRIIQELLGHSDISTTQIYTHVTWDTLRKEYDAHLQGGFTSKGDKK